VRCRSWGYKNQGGGRRVPCVIFVIPYNKKTGEVNMECSAIRYTTIVPPYSYSYDEADVLYCRNTGDGDNLTKTVRSIFYKMSA